MLSKVDLDPDHILIVLHGSIGDVTRALPLANLVRRGYPKATITWSIEPSAFPLVEQHPAVDRVIVFDRTHWWKTAAPFLRQIRSRHFDLVLDLQRILKSGLISWWSRAPCRVGFHRRDCKEFNWIFNNHYIPATKGAISKLNHYLKFAEFLGLKPFPIEWGISLTAEEERRVENMLLGVGSSFAAWFVGSRWESKLWFPEQTAKSAAEVRRRYGLEIVLLGDRRDVSFAEEVVAYSGLRATNYVGKTSLREAVGILSRARIAIGPDTGLMHLSAAVGTPVVSLWGATSPIRTGPYGYESLVIQGRAACSPCYLRRCPIGRICMQSIDVAEVLVKVGKALSGENTVRGVEI
jgi:lipopolysaccharide heptosyltransferase II